MGMGGFVNSYACSMENRHQRLNGRCQIGNFCIVFAAANNPLKFRELHLKMNTAMGICTLLTKNR